MSFSDTSWYCLKPITLGRGICLKNRLYFAPMGIDVANTDGCASSELVDFYRGVIDGGPGMVVLGNASIHPSTRLQERGLCLHNSKHAEALRPLIRYGDERGCLVVVQLQHYGAQGNTNMSGGQLLSPSGSPCLRMQRLDPVYRVVAMSVEDIQKVRQQFVAAAGRARGVGARMVQLQAANGYLLSSFLSPYTNRRSDEYGGDQERRMRLLCEVISDIRSAYPDLEVSVRLGIDDGLDEGGLYPGLISPHVSMLSKAGAAAITLSMTIGETFHLLITPSERAKERLASGIRKIRSSTDLPVGYAGFVTDMQSAEHSISELGVDFVGMTRALFADNDLILKTLQGRADEINACRFDSNCFRDKSNPQADRVYCCVNPRYLRPSHIKYNQDN